MVVNRVSEFTTCEAGDPYLIVAKYGLVLLAKGLEGPCWLTAVRKSGAVGAYPAAKEQGHHSRTISGLEQVEARHKAGKMAPPRQPAAL